MIYWTKVIIQKIIGFLPFSTAIKLNQFIVEKITGSLESKLDYKHRINKGLNNLALLKEKSGIDYLGRQVLELGTGWHGIDLLLFYLTGAKSITTIDHFEHLNLSELNISIDNILEFDYSRFIHQSVIKEDRLSHLKMIRKIEYSTINEILKKLNINYLVLDYNNLEDLSSKLKNVDILYSESVLQRLEHGHLHKLQLTLKTIASQDFYFFHRIDQCDINSQAHVGSSRNRLKFLRYSDLIFGLLNSRKLNNQNRLRHDDFVTVLYNDYTKVYVYGRYTLSDQNYFLSDAVLRSKYAKREAKDIIVCHSILIGSNRLLNTEAQIIYEVSDETDCAHRK